MGRLRSGYVGPRFTAFSLARRLPCKRKSLCDLVFASRFVGAGVRLYADSIIFIKPSLFNRHRNGRLLRFNCVVSTKCDIPFGWASLRHVATRRLRVFWLCQKGYKYEDFSFPQNDDCFRNPSLLAQRQKHNPRIFFAACVIWIVAFA